MHIPEEELLSVPQRMARRQYVPTSSWDEVRIQETEYYLPINPTLKVKGVITSKCTVFKSAKAPVKYSFNVTKDTRSSVLGQKAVTILFKSSQGISKALLEKVEKKLILGGRHTYLLEADENVKENELPVIIKHLNEAGIVVLLLTHNDNQIQALLDSKSEVTSYEKEQKHEEDIVSFVRKVSSYEYGLVKDSSFI